MTQYSGDPQTEWDLNALRTKEDVLAAVRRLRYKGGNTFTGAPGPRDPSEGHTPGCCWSPSRGRCKHLPQEQSPSVVRPRLGLGGLQGQSLGAPVGGAGALREAPEHPLGLRLPLREGSGPQPAGSGRGGPGTGVGGGGGRGPGPHALGSGCAQGLALTHVLEHNLRPAAGPRPEATKVLILVTDGKSQDDARAAGRILKDLGVAIFAVGEQPPALPWGPPGCRGSLHPGLEVPWRLCHSEDRSLLPELRANGHSGGREGDT